MKRILNEVESYQLFHKYGIDVIEYKMCTNLKEALEQAKDIGYPVVAKVISKEILHKTDAGCVYIGAKEPVELEKAWNMIMSNAFKNYPNAKVEGILIQKMAKNGLELIVGVKRDLQFGPIILFGLGGIYTEIFDDVSIRLLPICFEDAEEMIKETKIYKMLSGARGKCYDVNSIITALQGVSKMIEENNDIIEVDVNPLFVFREGVMAADGLIIIEEK
ncbi:acetate--CoA ligase family protein [Thermovenabulum sp.]|uniref:acetate--CoA ligase family protein n=1 Tax=Thermovenabulum sp. TaxID=3100335 RepID=UPI003C7C1827